MRSVRILVLAAGLLVITATNAAAMGHVVDYFEIAFPQDGSRTVINDLTGSGSWDGLGATWTVSDLAAELTFNGTFFSETYTPSFIIMWYSLGETMPLSVTITSSTGSEYRIAPAIQLTSEDPVDTSMIQWYVSGDAYFGHHFPDAYMAYFQVTLLDPYDPYDMTISMEWGTGVPNDEMSWDEVKSLYR